ncbi:MAG TPA: protoporphyrinogen oxidase [Planctomycetota bacterium]
METVVVGAGLSGLAFAHARRRARPEEELLVLEAGPRPGGLVRTVAEQGYRFEEGPEALPERAPALRALCAELALELVPAPRAARRRYLALDGKLMEVPDALEDLATSRVLSFSAKLRLMAEASCAPGEALDGSIADFARHRFGNEALERVVDPLVAGIHAGDPAQLSLRACFPEVVRMVEEHGSITAALKARAQRKQPRDPGASLAGSLLRPAGGMEQLARALARELGAQLRLEASVRAIEREAHGFRVREASGTIHQARRVVLALPLDPARTLLGAAAPEAATALASMEAESLVAVVHAYRRADVAHGLEGFGYLVPRSAGGIVLGTLFSSSLAPDAAPPGQVLLRSLLGGARHPSLAELTDDELVARTRAECTPFLGLSGAPTFARVARYPRAIPRLDLEHPARRARLAAALSEGLHVLGSFTRGVGLESLVAEARALAATL